MVYLRCFRPFHDVSIIFRPQQASHPRSREPAARRGYRPSLADDGPIVEFEGRRYQVGRAGDVAVVGDWPRPAGTCDGSATVVLLRPGTGELFAFDGWAETGELLATRLETHRGAIGLGVDSGHCDTLLLVDAEGGRTPITIG